MLADGSEIEILVLTGTIVKRLNTLGVTNTKTKEDGMHLILLKFLFVENDKIVYLYRTLVSEYQNISFETDT